MDEKDKPDTTKKESLQAAPPQESHQGDPPATQPATAEQLTEVEEQMSGFEKSTLRWAKTAVIMSALAAIFVCAQWWEMHESGKDTRTLAEAAKKSSELAFIQAEAQAADDCEIGTGITDDLADAYLIVSCVKGNVYSTIKAGEFTAEVDGIGRNRTLWKSPKISIEPQTIAPSGISRRVSFSVARYSREDFYALKQVLKVQGFFDYDDGFGRIIHKPFCTYFHVFRDQAGGIYRGLTNTPCDQLPALLRGYAAADQQQRKQRPKPN